MGVDRTLFINSSWGVRDVADLVRTIEAVENVKIMGTHEADYTLIGFTYLGADGKEDRQISFHRSSNRAGFVGTLLTLRANGCSELILKTIAERLGGFYEHQDCDGQIERFDFKADGNLGFMIRQAIIEGKSDGLDVDEFTKYHHEKTASWQRNNPKLKL